MAYAAGVDVGSTQTKAAIVNEDRELIATALIDTGSNVIVAAESVFEKALKSSGISNTEVEYVIGTGYGRYRVTFGNDQVTEISCHGRGAVHSARLARGDSWVPRPLRWSYRSMSSVRPPCGTPNP